MRGRAIAALRGHGRGGEISHALSQRRNGGVFVVGILIARPRVVDEVERLGAALVDVRNIQWATDGAAEAVGHPARLGRRLVGQGKRAGIQRRVADGVENRSMGTIDVEAAAPAAAEEDRRTSETAAPAAETTAATAQDSAARTTILLLKLLNALAKFIAIERSHRILRGPGDRHRFGS